MILDTEMSHREDRKLSQQTPATDVFVAIGGNLPDAFGRSALFTCRAAVEALRALSGLRLIEVSPLYESDPIPPGGPTYINGVAWLSGHADPAELLARLQRIETAGGRVRTVQNAPRTLDLDIIAIGQSVRDCPDPILPHPRAHLRRFVMQPLADLCPNWRHPVLGRTAAEILAELPEQGIRRL
jgi:2-amino-4-hydroxy-6-hydroxymethyldihydropteridine diphosphokinase